MKTNPLFFSHTKLPPLSKITPQHVVEGLPMLLAEYAQTVDNLLTIKPDSVTWGTLMPPLEQAYLKVEQACNLVNHLALADTKTFEKYTALANDTLQKALSQIEKSRRWYALRKALLATELTPEQRVALSRSGWDGARAYARITKKNKEKEAKWQIELAKLAGIFDNNVLQASKSTHALKIQPNQMTPEEYASFSKMPPWFLQRGRHQALEANLESGWIYYPFSDSQPFLKYCGIQRFRHKMYKLRTGLASSVLVQSQAAFALDNTPVAVKILALRQKYAEFYGYANYAELAVSDNYLNTPKKIAAFLRKLQRDYADDVQMEHDEIKAYGQTLGLIKINKWDTAWLETQLNKEKGESLEFRRLFPLTETIEKLVQFYGNFFGYKVKCLKAKAPASFLFAIGNSAHLQINIIKHTQSTLLGWSYPIRPSLVTPDGSIRVKGFSALGISLNKIAATVGLSFQEILVIAHELGHAFRQSVPAFTEYLNTDSYMEEDAREVPSMLFERFAASPEFLELLSKKPAYALFEQIVENHFKKTRLVTEASESLIDLQVHSKFNPKKRESLYAFLEGAYAAANLPPPRKYETRINSMFCMTNACNNYMYVLGEHLGAQIYAKWLTESKQDFKQKTAASRLFNTLFATGGKLTFKEQLKAYLT